MPGLYLHIPFCRQACHYCDFHFSTNLKNKTAMVHAIVRELQLQKNYFQNTATNILQTIYFGGGTPSLLDPDELALIFEAIKSNFTLAPNPEITIECNPEDLSTEKLMHFKQLGINRLSIGIQTFDNAILKYMNRVHDASQAIEAVKNAQELGFDNITIDLMYALPNSTSQSLQNDLDLATSLGVSHISAYCFTLEEKTVFGKWEKQKKLTKNEDSYEHEQFTQLYTHLAAYGYEQYEISNYARENRYSKHNSAYWFGEHYLGIGPGAHAYNGHQRQWNVTNNTRYIEKLQNNELACEIEQLSDQDNINETILIQLRTKWGLNLEQLSSKFGFDLLKEKEQKITQLIHNELIEIKDQRVFLTKKGIFLADGIVVELMV